MTTDEILSIARSAGIRLESRGDTLHVEAPRGVLTPELRDALACHKPALLARLAPVTEFITLRNGPTLPAPAVLLALDLERRGFRLSLDAADQVVIEPTEALTDLDRAGIARWRLHLGAIVAYEPPICA